MQVKLQVVQQLQVVLSCSALAGGQADHGPFALAARTAAALAKIADGAPRIFALASASRS